MVMYIKAYSTATFTSQLNVYKHSIIFTLRTICVVANVVHESIYTHCLSLMNLQVSLNRSLFSNEDDICYSIIFTLMVRTVCCFLWLLKACTHCLALFIQLCLISKSRHHCLVDNADTCCMHGPPMLL